MEYVEPTIERKSLETDFTNEEILEIIDDFIQYKSYYNPSICDEDYPPISEYPDFLLSLIDDFNISPRGYSILLHEIEKKYGVHMIENLSKEKLNFNEIIIILVFMNRTERHGGYPDEHQENFNIYYNLLCRLEEIKNEL